MSTITRSPFSSSRVHSITLSVALGFATLLGACASDEQEDSRWVTLSDEEAADLSDTAVVLERGEVATMVMNDEEGGLRTTSAADYWVDDGEVAFGTTVECTATCPGGCVKTGCMPLSNRPACSRASGCSSTGDTSGCPTSNTCTTTIRRDYE